MMFLSEKKMLWLIFALVGLVFFCFIFIAKAEACSANAIYSNRSLGSVSVPANVSIGQQLALFGSFSGSASALNCGYIPYMWLAFEQPMVKSSVTYNGYEVYDTNVDGVGVQVYTTFGKTVMIGNTPKYWYQHNTSGGAAYLASIYVRFIVTGPLKSGVIQLPIPTIKALTSRYYSVVSSDSAIYNRMGFGSSIVTAPTCTVNNSEQTVLLPEVSTSDFLGVGTTAESVPFGIVLDCDAGVSVYATVSDTNQLSNTGPNLSLDGSSTASGVGIQLLQSGNPLSFGNPVYISGTGIPSASTYSVPFEARYVQTSTIINPGTVIAKTVISFSYL
ncbi:Fimbrial protein [Shewanella sp. MR-4]|uniref:fimbrial protein n=1 Tax=Shewanella sp. (strain MR-4) TaxID=60480 RepID=UPI00005E5675|nr:fimbrial protein [Shewanella sp. MR-4]ABI39312.1 Fimbrial protein [Shewanella sp. MR-4]